LARSKFLGHIVSQDGIHPDPEKVSAINQMKTPQNVSDLRRFMGLVNQLGKFSSAVAQISQPLRELLSTKRAWLWGPAQEEAFRAVKTEMAKPSVLAFYDPAAETKVSADASSFGLGAVLFQKSGEVWKPVAYASRSLSETEQHYAQIEKEALATTWACEKFSTYLIGKTFDVETDHKPLVPLLNTKHLDDLPPRILRFRLSDQGDFGIGRGSTGVCGRGHTTITPHYSEETTAICSSSGSRPRVLTGKRILPRRVAKKGYSPRMPKTLLES